MVELAKFPKKEKRRKKKKKVMSTYDKRNEMIEDLYGEYNGWWIYQFMKQPQKNKR